MNKRSFIKYFIYVFTYGVIGTILTFSIVAPLTYVANSNKMFYYSYFDEKLLHPQNGNSHEVHGNAPKNGHEANLVNSTLPLTPEKEHTAEISQKAINETSPVQETANENDPYLMDLSIKDILLFSSVISSSDAIAALAFISEDKDPKLFAILFGEGVVNDAVCIVIYKIMREFIDSGEGKIFNDFFNF